MFALLALFGDTGCASGPALVGRMTTLFGDSLGKGLLFGVVFPAVMIVCVWKIRNAEFGKRNCDEKLIKD